MAVMTLLDIVKRNAALTDGDIGLIDEAVRVSPEVQLGAARTIKGLNYQTRVRTGLPAVGFRSINNGVAPTKSTVENRTVSVFPVNPYWRADKMMAEKSEDGAAAVLAEEAEAHVKAAFMHCASQFYYGTGNDTLGFPGLVSAVDSDLEVDATGSTADTGSSVWVVTFGDTDVRWVAGQEGEFKISDPTEQLLAGENGQLLTFLCQELSAWIGLQVGNKFSIGRIKKLTAQSGKTLTDDMITDLLMKFPVGRLDPNRTKVFMSRRSRGQLQKSRTATNPTGAPAPLPERTIDGYEIIPTDAIKDTEAVS
jgi:hypothetical protein